MLVLMALLSMSGDLQLICTGETGRRGRSTIVSDGLENPSIIRRGRDRGEIPPQQVRLELRGDSARITLPPDLIPFMRRRGPEDWWPIEELRSGDIEVTGQIVLNRLARTRLHLDRSTGALTLSGRSGSFAGTCTPQPG